jgi:uncharacterized protein YoxC
VNGWSEVSLGVIAVAAVVIAVMQVALIVALLRAMREAQQTLRSVQQEVKPLLVKATAVADEAARTAVLATAQAEKVDRLLTDLARRVEETAAIVQHAIVTPAREGMAIVAGLKAGLAALRGFREMRERRRHAEEEDPLFIG